MTDVWQKISEDAVPSLISGGIALLAYNMIFGESITDSIAFGGGSAPAWAIIGGGVFGSQLVGNVLQNQVLSYIQTPSLAGTEGMIVKPLLAGGTLYGLFRFGVSEDTNLLQTVGLGAGSVIAGQYASNLIGY